MEMYLSNRGNSCNSSLRYQIHFEQFIHKPDYIHKNFSYSCFFIYSQLTL
jgi:hypothetical protein